MKGIVGENNIFLSSEDYYTTYPVIQIIKYNEILCDNDIHVTLKTSINKYKMKKLGFTSEVTSCFNYGFPTNWVAISEYFFLQNKSQKDVSLPNKLKEEALQNMNDYKNIYFQSAIDIANWYLKVCFSV